MVVYSRFFGDFLAKNGHFATLRSHKKTKKQNIKNLTDRKFLNITRNIYTKNWTNRTNIEEEDRNLLQKLFLIFCRIGEKKSFFRQKIGQFLTKFAKILQMNKNHLNTSYVKIVGHLGHFFWHFWSFLVIFWPHLAYIII